MWDNVQIIKENDQARFAVIPFTDYVYLKELLSDSKKLEDYLDYLHMQKVKAESQGRLGLADVKRELGLSLSES